MAEMEANVLKKKETEAHKRGKKKWDAENMLTLSCRLRRECVEKFRETAKSKGMTANQMIKQFVLEQITENKK